jgi:hypothetical protein
MTPRTHFDQVLDPYDTGTTFILADFTGDGKMEIFLRHAWEIVIVDGRGQQLTAVHPQGNRPYYYTDGPLWNNPAVGDLDGDGHLELVVQNSKLTVWDLPTSSALADWPMFKLDAARGGAQEPVAKVITNEIFLFAEVGQGAEHEQSVIVFGRLGKFDWKVRSNQPTNITFPQTTGIMLGKEEIGVNVRVPSGLPLGDHTLGNVEVEVSHSGSVEMTDTVPVKVRVVNQLSKNFLPLVR